MTIQRYEEYYGHGDHLMLKDNQGEWVRYEDHARVVEELERVSVFKELRDPTNPRLGTGTSEPQCGYVCRWPECDCGVALSTPTITRPLSPVTRSSASAN